VQWLHGLYRPDRYEYQMQLSRVGDIAAKVWVSRECPRNSIEDAQRRMMAHAPLNRRRFVAQSGAAATALAFPLVGGAQPKPVRVGVLHPVTGRWPIRASNAAKAR
jgi:hypothetical protein